MKFDDRGGKIFCDSAFAFVFVYGRPRIGPAVQAKLFQCRRRDANVEVFRPARSGSPLGGINYALARLALFIVGCGNGDDQVEMLFVLREPPNIVIGIREGKARLVRPNAADAKCLCQKGLGTRSIPGAFLEVSKTVTIRSGMPAFVVLLNTRP